MAKSEVKKVSRIKVKKKLWYKIISPKIFGEKEVGETYLASPESAIGRVTGINLRDMTGSVRDQQAYLQFKIEKVQGSNLYTSVVGYKLTTSYIRRAVRKNADRMDDYFEAVTKDGRRIVIKTLMITISKTHRSARSALRRMLKESLEEEVKKVDLETFIGSLVNNKIQMGIRKKMAKIYPLRELAIKILELKRTATGEEVERAPVSEPAPEPVPETPSKEEAEKDESQPEETEDEESSEN